MELIIVRHAVAFERDPKRWPDDGQRPLTPAGIARARRAAAGAKHLLSSPRTVLTSPLLRAVQTAELLQKECRWPAASACPELEPEADPESLLERLRDARGSPIAIVGHQPGLGRFLAYCIGSGRGSARLELRKFGMAGVRFESAPRGGAGELQWLLRPRMLRTLAR